MIDTTFAEKKLQPGFTFRIVEAIKSTKVQPISTKPLLPFIGSATVGIVLTFMLFNQFLRPVATPGDLTSSPLPSEIQMSMFGEIPVELMVEASKPPTVLGERGTGVVGNSPEQPRQMNAANVKNSKTEIPASYKLANGLTVILRPVPSSNQVAIVVLYDLGATTTRSGSPAERTCSNTCIAPPQRATRQHATPCSFRNAMLLAETHKQGPTTLFLRASSKQNNSLRS